MSRRVGKTQRSILEKFKHGEVMYELFHCTPKFCEYHYWIEKDGLTIARSGKKADIYESWQKIIKEL